MFFNLLAEIARKGLNLSEFAQKVEMKPSTFRKKIKGETSFNIFEMKRIAAFVDPEKTKINIIDYLFFSENEVQDGCSI